MVLAGVCRVPVRAKAGLTRRRTGSKEYEGMVLFLDSFAPGWACNIIGLDRSFGSDKSYGRKVR